MKLRVVAVVVAAMAVAAGASGQAWRYKIDTALAKRVSYRFDKMALADVVKTLSQDAGVNVILDDSSAAGIDPAQKLSMHYKGMSIGSVLNWVTRGTNLQWCVQDEAIFITSYDRLDQQAKLQIEARQAEERVQAVKTWVPAMQEALAKNISATFNSESLSDCGASLEALLGVNVILSASLDATQPVAISVSDMSGESVLAWVARKAGIDFAVVDEAVFFARPEELASLRSAGLDFSARGKGAQLVTFDFKDEDVRNAFAVLSEKSGVKIVFTSDVDAPQRVTLSGKDMSLASAIQAVAKAAGCNNAIVPQGDSYLVRFMKGAPAAPAMESTGVPAAAPTESTAPQAAPAGEGAGTVPSGY